MPRYEICKQNVLDFNLENKVNVSPLDIVKSSLDNDYDLIFIDGAKRHTIDHFEFLKNKIKANGIIIVDNIDLKVVEKIESARKRNKYIKAVKETKEFFENIRDFNCVYLPIGDGIYKITK